MDRTYQQAEQYNADALSQRIEQTIREAKISNLGWLVIVRLPRSSIFTIAALTDTTCNLSGTDYEDRKHGLEAVSWDAAVKFLQDVEAGAQPVQEIDRLSEPFGRDPLGAQERNEGRCLRETHSKNGIQESTLPRMLYGSELFKHLKAFLPLSDDESFADDAGNFIVSVDPLRVRVVPKGANLYDVQAWIGEKPQPKQVQISYEESRRPGSWLARLTE